MVEWGGGEGGLRSDRSLEEGRDLCECQSSRVATKLSEVHCEESPDRHWKAKGEEFGGGGGVAKVNFYIWGRD